MPPAHIVTNQARPSGAPHARLPYLNPMRPKVVVSFCGSGARSSATDRVEFIFGLDYGGKSDAAAGPIWAKEASMALALAWFVSKFNISQHAHAAGG